MPEPPVPKVPQTAQSDDAKSREELVAELANLRMENGTVRNFV